MELGLKGKTAIVTGGASNIGRAISMTLAAEGVNVVIADIDEEQSKKVVKTIKDAGGKAVAITTDATKYDAVEATVKKVVDQFGKIDILVNNLGWERVYYFVETTPDFWDKIIAINFRAAMNFCRTVLPHMIEKQAGAVVNIGSDAGRIGEFKEAVYGGCKAAVISLTRSLARENGRYGIRLNVVCPGMTPADSADEVGKYAMAASRFREDGTPDPEWLERREKAAKNYPLRRLGKPQDIANAVAFFASDAASDITGQTISVSGGYSMV